MMLAIVAAVVLGLLSACGDAGAPIDASTPDGSEAGLDAAMDGAVDAVIDADAAPPGRTFWIASDGDDAAEGTSAAPFASFSHAIAQLAPGDTLVAKSGSVFGRLSYDCLNASCDGAPCPSGERGRPITVRAEAPRTVELTQVEEGLIVRDCSHVVIDGFEVHQRDEMSTSYANIALVTNSDYITVRNMLLHTLNRWPNGHVMYFSRSRHVLFEDSEIYDFHRGGLMITGSEHVTARRIYINGRDTPNLPDPAFNCCCLSDADYGVFVDGSFDVTVENTIVERVCQPFQVLANNTDLEGPRGGTGVRILGSVALTAPQNGFTTRSYCEDRNPCPEESRVRDVEIVHSVSIDAEDGFYLNATADVLLRNVTAIDSRGDDFDFGVATDNVAVEDSSFLVVNALDVGVGGVGYEITDQRAGAILSSNSFGNDSVFDPMFEAVGHGTTDPQMGGCYVYVPDSSPMRGAGAGGEDIGARIVNRYVGGVLTDQPLWDPATGAFPCGAIVDGVNDEASFAGQTCSTVHERLHVGSAGCAIP